jgi:hypothetical protein
MSAAFDVKTNGNQRRNRIPLTPTQAPFTEDERAMLRKPMRYYEPELAQLVIEKMSDGYSLGGFAGQIGVARRTINRWMELHPEFEESCSRAMAVRQHWFEKRFLDVCETGGAGSQGQAVIFGLINAGREDWKQKQEIEHTGQITLASLVESSLRTIDAQAIDVTPQYDDAPSSEPSIFD